MKKTIGILAHVDAGENHAVRGGFISRKGHTVQGPGGPPGFFFGYRRYREAAASRCFPARRLFLSAETSII